jgi:hypothetical protein
MIEVLKQALEALEKERPYLGAMPTLTSKAITSLRQAIAELESQDDSYCQACDGALCTAKKGCVALSNPPQRKPLTDEEIFKVHKQVDSMQYLTFARAIEAAHGIKE